MRKILFNPRFENVNVVDWEYDRILIKTEDGTVQEISVKIDREQENFYSKYTSQEIRMINIINSKLDQSMTEEEIDYMLTKGLGRPERLDPETTAARAGYRIEKKIVPL